MFPRYCLLAGAAWMMIAAGCGGGVPEQQIEVKAANDPLHVPRSVLERYAQGQPLGSEVTSFPGMVEAVRKTDPARADILEAGLEEIQNASAPARRSKARELLDQLKPSMSSNVEGQAEADPASSS